ncbi:MAG: Hint domain-containing protein [Paracoccaceae bacterium]
MLDFVSTITKLNLVEPSLWVASPVHVTSGIVAGTLVEGAQGWCPVETLKVGDRVQTLDGGLARILDIDRHTLQLEPELSLILVPGGCHDSCSDLLLVPGQHVIIDADAEDDFGAAFALLPAVALMSDPLVRRHFPTGPLEIVTLLFADEEVVYANSGMLLHCPGVKDVAGCHPDNSFFPRLDVVDSREFLQRRAVMLAA